MWWWWQWRVRSWSRGSLNPVFFSRGHIPFSTPKRPWYTPEEDDDDDDDSDDADDDNDDDGSNTDAADDDDMEGGPTLPTPHLPHGLLQWFKGLTKSFNNITRCSQPNV